MPFKTVIQLLPKLSKAERKQVALRLAALGAKIIDEPVPDQDWFQEGLLAALRQRGILAGRPPPLFAEQYKAHAKSLQSWFVKGGGANPPARLGTIVVATLFGQLLLDHLSAARVPLSLRTFSQNLDKIPAVVEDAFPGYWQAGLFNMLVGHGKNSDFASRSSSRATRVQRNTQRRN